MEILWHSSAAYPAAKHVFVGGFGGSTAPKNANLFSVQSCSFRGSAGLRKAVIVGAKKKNDNKKEDRHSFAVKPDEATGPFPEAVLLREKRVQENGKVVPEFADAEEEKLFEFLNLELQSQEKTDRMRHYEVVYLIHEDHAEEVDSVNEKVQDFLREKKGKIWRFSDWGMRSLAYKIKKANNAHYILMNFELEAKWINDFKMLLDKDERVIRHLVIKRDEAITEGCPPPPEYHTLGADDDDEEYEYDEEDDEASDEEDDEDWDEEGEVEGVYDEMEDDTVIFIDDDEVDDDEDDDGSEDRTNSSAVQSNKRGKGRLPEKIGR